MDVNRDGASLGQLIWLPDQALSPLSVLARSAVERVSVTNGIAIRYIYRVADIRWREPASDECRAPNFHQTKLIFGEGAVRYRHSKVSCVSV